MSDYSRFRLQPGDKIRRHSDHKVGYVANFWGKMDRPSYDPRFIDVKWENGQESIELPASDFDLVERNWIAALANKPKRRSSARRRRK